jgi:hypothetical protein
MGGAGSAGKGVAPVTGLDPDDGPMGLLTGGGPLRPEPGGWTGQGGPTVIGPEIGGLVFIGGTPPPPPGTGEFPPGAPAPGSGLDTGAGDPLLPPIFGFADVVQAIEAIATGSASNPKGDDLSSTVEFDSRSDGCGEGVDAVTASSGPDAPTTQVNSGATEPGPGGTSSGRSGSDAGAVGVWGVSDILFPQRARAKRWPSVAGVLRRQSKPVDGSNRCSRRDGKKHRRRHWTLPGRF